MRMLLLCCQPELLATPADSGSDPALNAALVAADFAHFEALRSSEARRLGDMKVARTAFREMKEPH